MLKTNSKKAAENIRGYIIANFTPESYTDKEFSDFSEIAEFILETFRKEKYSVLADFRYYRGNESAAFADWCAGLPSVLDTCYYYNRSAVDDLAVILEQTGAEKVRYTDESKAETIDRWDIMTNYSYGWECECSEYTYKEARQRVKEYRENTNADIRLEKHREPINNDEEVQTL